MTEPLTDAQVKEALQTCADEPVHIPGLVQPVGCLISLSAETNVISYASENCAAFLGLSPSELLGRKAREVLPGELWHGVRNAVSRTSIASETISAGAHDLGDQRCVARVHQSGDQHVVEIEPDTDIGLEGPAALQTLSYLMGQIQACGTQERLFELTVELLQHLSGYDRVLIYRFDAEWNGEVLAEVTHGNMDGFIGLRFPHWDIPKQARDIMARLPLRFIQDTEQTPVPLLAKDGMPPLDISLAELRGVSPVHMEYLRNMGTAATMTLSVKVNNRLWGIISFHHRRPKVPAPALRAVLSSFLMIFCGKLEALQQQSAMDRIQALDQGFASQSHDDYDIEAMLPAAASVIMDVMNAHGIAVTNRGEITQEGNVPDPAVVKQLADQALFSGELLAVETLPAQYPEYADRMNGVAGVLVVCMLPHRAVCIFRNEIERETAWAGNPEKKIETIDDRVRLSPRGSFTTFLEQVKGRSEPWTENDTYLVGHLRTLLNAAERQTVMDTLNRQQTMMIAELNHRVRNILALVRSVSRQARRRYASLDSYANAIENRVRALAAAHDISGGRSTMPVSIYSLFRLEFEPFQTQNDLQATIEGPDRYLKPDVAPIFSLVIHELTTNAAKYGSLLRSDGRIKVELSIDTENFNIKWRETGGPEVNHPNDLGFGMALIEQAIPHELGGTADVGFSPEGLRANFSLPLRHFTGATPENDLPFANPIMLEEATELPQTLREGTILVLEDNYIIAKEMSDQLRDLGCADVRTCATAQAAFEILENEPLSLAVLDVNLGPGQTSKPVAIRLVEQGVPFVFVTGYGENADLPTVLERAPRLTKPISSIEFLAAVSNLAPK